MNFETADHHKTIPGSRCAFALCGSHDFLPAKCDFCHSSFCARHLSPSTHSCPNAPTPGCSNNTQPPDKPTTSINTAKCHSCKKTFMPSLLVKCSKCFYSYCLTHRHSDQHKCRKEAPPPRSVFHLPGRNSSKMAKRRRKNAATGDVEVELGERVYVDVLGVEGFNIEPKMFFFKNSFSIGRVLDIICDNLGISESRFYNLFDEKRGELRKSLLLKELNSNLDVFLKR
ncbi:hypothetical protein P9112_000278 [Eukaryota sp. TZLM1-RC]